MVEFDGVCAYCVARKIDVHRTWCRFCGGRLILFAPIKGRQMSTEMTCSREECEAMMKTETWHKIWQSEIADYYPPGRVISPIV